MNWVASLPFYYHTTNPWVTIMNPHIVTQAKEGLEIRHGKGKAENVESNTKFDEKGR